MKTLIINFILFVIVVNILAVFIEKKIIGDLGMLGDAQIYYCGAIKFKQGLNPYDFANFIFSSEPTVPITFLPIEFKY